MRAVRVRAYAKVNLALEILGRRDDGFHEIVSVTQTVSLHDLVECAPADGLTVTTEPPLVAPEDNLARQAAELLAAETGRPANAVVRIRKQIPLAAGLGGGSSDAAATLRGLDRLWDLGLGPARLHHLAGRLGSDVPLFLAGGTALIRGRGELVERLPPPTPFWLAIAVPPYQLENKTRALYAALHQDAWTDGRQTLLLAEQLRAGADAVGEALPNAFDRAADETYPGFAELRARLTAAAGRPVRLTGAGPSLFALFNTHPEAAAAAERISRLEIPCFVARSVAKARVTIATPLWDRS